MRIPGKSITDSTVIAISRSTAKRTLVPRQFDQAIPALATREGGRYLVESVLVNFSGFRIDFPLRAIL